MKSKAGESVISLIKTFEGLRLSAYQDIAGVWTIGYGSTRSLNGDPIKRGDKLENESQAANLLLNMLKTFEVAVNKSVKVALNNNQFNALLSFVYNVGTGAFISSTLLKMLNAGNYKGAADQLLNWNKVTDPRTGKKVVSATLTERRKKERILFLKQ